MSLKKDLNELLEAGIISEDSAAAIQQFYEDKKNKTPNRLLLIFGVLGAILISLGLILIIAHNWDQLPRWSKMILAFIPLLIGQGLCVYTLIRKKEKTYWVEVSSSFLFLAVGACLSMISQIYNIPGTTADFLWIWILLCLPIMYIMGSYVSALLYWGFITYFALESGYFNRVYPQVLWYWLFFFLGLPFYIQLFRSIPRSNAVIFHNWIIPLSLILSLGTITTGASAILFFVSYISLFSFFYMIGNILEERGYTNRRQGYHFQGQLGSIIILFIMSFKEIWWELVVEGWEAKGLFYIFLFLVLINIALLAREIQLKGIKKVSPFAYLFLFFALLFLFNLLLAPLFILINLLILAYGVYTIINGVKLENLRELNFGLLIITALIICRFFDTDISFTARGIIFVVVGISFFIANFLMLKKQKNAPA